MKNLSVSTTDECRTSLEILRYTQDDNEEENKRNKDKGVSFRAQSRNPLEADQGNSVYNAPTARRSFVTLRMTAKRKTRETKTKTNN